jgi:uncharacterized damage-inducible protein DinB
MTAYRVTLQGETMKNATRMVVSLLLFTTVAAASARAQAPAAAPSFQADYATDVDFVGKRLVDLANAIPAEKYSWRPTPGVRSVSEVFMHVVGADYLLPSLIGGKLPDGFSRDMEKTVTDKAKVIEWLKKGMENARAAGTGMSNADLDKKVTVKFLGGEVTQRRVLMIVETHMHEHLGQSIAYARSIGVTPPWSEGDAAPPAKKSGSTP